MDRHVVAISASSSITKKIGDAWDDFISSLVKWHVWVALAWQDIVSRYRGSVLGPLWITVSMGAMIGGMALLYSQLFHIDPRIYVPYLSVGIVMWGYLAGTIQEACGAFAQGAPIIRQSNMPMFVFIWRTLYRNVIVLGHNMIIVLVTLAVSGMWMHVRPFEFLAGGVLLSLNLLWISMLLSVLGARFKDVTQIVAALMQVAFFLTPIFWRPEGITRGRQVLDLNPLYHLLEIVRAPVIGGPFPLRSWEFSAIMLVAGWALVFPYFAAQRRRVVHYL
jgi:ABC-type polysaccharide/polyol phosphate export permease